MFRKAPLTVMALAVVIVEILLFMFYVPSGGDLISPKGDESLGARRLSYYSSYVRPLMF